MGPHPQHRRAVTLALGAILALSACSSASPSESAAPSTAASVAESMEPSESGGPISLPAPELTELQIGNSGPFSASNLHAVISSYDKLYEKYGFTSVEWLTFGGGSEAVQANIAGQVDLSDNSGGPVIASLLTDAPLIMTYIVRSNLTDCIAVRPDIQTADDLRGEAVAISSFGSVSHAGALVGLGGLGLTSDDVVITQIGGGSDRFAALQSESVAAAILDTTEIAPIAELGFHCLINLAEVADSGGVARTSLTFTREFIDQYPNTVLNLTAMYAEAQLLWREDPAHTAEALAALAEIDAADARDQVDQVLSEPWRPLDGRCTPDIMEFTRQTLLPDVPDLADVDPSDACTNDFIDQLDDMGYYAQLGVPGS